MTTPSDIARRLADRAEAVCRRYLSHGRREGRYWLVGDVRNTPGRSLYVRLTASPDGRGAAGKWTDSATGEHGDLLDIIASAQGHSSFRETLDEARHFLTLAPEKAARRQSRRRRSEPAAPLGPSSAARRLIAASRPIAATPGAAYLRARGIERLETCDALFYHPRCYYRPSPDDPPGTARAMPAMIATVTDLAGNLTGAHRTWLDPRSRGKAIVACPRRAMGRLLGNGVRFGAAGEVMAAGEGIETILSLRELLPDMPMIAGLSAAHLAAIDFPGRLRRLYIARDADAAGAEAFAILVDRAAAAGIDLRPLDPQRGDFNDDLVRLGRDAMGDAVSAQLASADRERFRGRREGQLR